MLLAGGRSKNKMIKTSKSGKQKLEAGQIFFFSKHSKWNFSNVYKQ